MKTKTTGSELKAFWGLGDPWWPVDGFVDGDAYIVNGNTMGDEFEPGLCADTDQITIIAGVIASNAHDDEGKDLQVVFRKWRKSLSTVQVIVELPKDDLEAFKKLMAQSKIKVIS
ncbi:MAG: hypothetical protein RR740_00265 [Pseudomonas sp.]